MKTLKEFTVWIPTTFGFGCFKIKAHNFNDAFFRLGKKNKLKNGFIENEEGESQTFNFILGIEEN